MTVLSKVTNETSKATIRFSFPDGMLDNIERMRLIGNDILVYTTEDSVESLSDNFKNMNFNLVEREYKLHVSTLDEETFKRVFGDIEYETRPSIDNRFIATVVTDTMEDYTRFLSYSENDVRVKPYNPRYAKAKSDDDHRRHNQEQEQSQDQSYRNRRYQTPFQTQKGKGKGKSYGSSYDGNWSMINKGSGKGSGKSSWDGQQVYTRR